MEVERRDHHIREGQYICTGFEKGDTNSSWTSGLPSIELHKDNADSGNAEVHKEQLIVSADSTFASLVL